MGTIKYQKLVNINIDHHFFANGYSSSGANTSPDLQIVALHSAQDLDKLGLRQTSFRTNGITIYGEMEKDESVAEEKYVLQKLIGKPDGCLYFAIMDLNPQYVALSNLPIEREQDHCLFLSNQNINTAEGILSKSATIDWSADSKQVQLGDFSFLHPEKLQEDEVYLVERDAKFKIKPAKLLHYPNLSTEVHFNKQQIIPGTYILIIKDQAKPARFFLGDWKSKTPLGIIELAWGPNVSAEGQIWENDLSPKATVPVFKAVFAQRKVKWKYSFLFNTIAKTGEEEPPTVTNVALKVDGVQEEAFTAEPITLPLKSAEFVSTSEFELEEEPSRKLILSYQIGNKPKTKKNISVPRAEHLRKTTNNQFQTHISITLLNF